MENESEFCHEGIVVKRKGYHPFIDIDLVDVELIEDIGRISAQFGLNPNHFPLRSPKKKENYTEDSYKDGLLQTVAAEHVAKQYANGHLTVFDLFHHYYSFHYGSFAFQGNQQFFGRPSLEARIGHSPVNEFNSTTEAIAHAAVLQGFYLHHLFQRYCCSANFDFGAWTDYAREQILQNQDLYALAQFLFNTESDFFRESSTFQKACAKRVKNLPPSKKVKIYSSCVNGIECGKVNVPKTAEYKRIIHDLKKRKESGRYICQDAVLFPSLFDDSQAGKLYQCNPHERSYLLSQHPDIFDVEKEHSNLRAEIIGQFPRFKEHSNAVDVLLKEGTYSFHIQTRLLD